MANPCAHDVASQATDSIRCPRAEGPSIYWITQGLYFTYNCVPQYMWGYFAEMYNKSHWILQRIYRLKVCNRRAFALSMFFRVSRSSPRVSGETITVISLWRHNNGTWDNGESISWIGHQNIWLWKTDLFRNSKILRHWDFLRETHSVSSHLLGLLLLIWTNFNPNMDT